MSYLLQLSLDVHLFFSFIIVFIAAYSISVYSTYTINNNLFSFSCIFFKCGPKYIMGASTKRLFLERSVNFFWVQDAANFDCKCLPCLCMCVHIRIGIWFKCVCVRVRAYLVIQCTMSLYLLHTSTLLVTVVFLDDNINYKIHLT